MKLLEAQESCRPLEGAIVLGGGVGVDVWKLRNYELAAPICRAVSHPGGPTHHRAQCQTLRVDVLPPHKHHNAALDISTRHNNTSLPNTVLETSSFCHARLFAPSYWS